MKKNTPIAYDYYVHSISEDDEPAYEAIIPAFDNAIVFGDSLEELERGVRFSIDAEIAERKKQKKPIPPPEKKTTFNGKILIRIEPVLHEKVFLEAKAAGKSVNGYIQEKLAKN
ncbi:toxin-antitoxin system HicB family antitoxin [Candidatus Peregrinibacteria bacterium]|nr:toxin-antitoxin system HicB family antitoxin [Candidatus Peregrinibacteria bacterium]